MPTPTNEAPATKVYIGTAPNQPVRLSFPNLFVPVAQDDEKPDEKKYGATFLLPPTYNMDALKSAVVAAVSAKWGPQGLQWLQSGALKLPFRNQAVKQHLTGYTEGWFIACTSKNKPGVVNENVEPIMDPSEIVAGNLVIATVNAYCWEHPKNGKGVGFGLLNVMKMADDGVRFGAAQAKPEEDFAQYRKAATSAGPNVGSADNLFPANSTAGANGPAGNAFSF